VIIVSNQKQGENLITAIVTSNSIVILALTTFFLRERNRRKALEELLRQSINYWRIAHETNVGGWSNSPNHNNDARL
jgi:hypothetical protein